MMLALVTAGEAVFFLPFVLPRIFRPTLLDVFGISNLQLGMAFSIYGVVAMLAYFPGGPLADRFDARKLMVIALVATSVGGLVMATIPSPDAVKSLYGFWGLTTILLFWSPLIRATRQWGVDGLSEGGLSERATPGRAFGILDGGRGLIAALIASLSVWLFAALIPADVQVATLAERSQAFGKVVLLFAAVTVLSAVLVWFALPQRVSSPNRQKQPARADGGIGAVLRMPTVWLQAVIVVCAYVAYKGLDDVSLYAKEVLLFDEVQAAKIGTVSMWMRPPAAVLAGLVADRFGVSKSTLVCFAAIAVGIGSLAAGLLPPGAMVLFFATLVTTSAAVFAVRGLYFALMEEGCVPMERTGTAVGIVSVIGYTPDVFMGPLMGWLLDRSPGEMGHRHLFAAVTSFAITGLIATVVFRRHQKLGSPGRLGEEAVVR
ncbi:Inner membrane protein YqcE [Stieleria neptunia]|uniref:Inner membrane protein YqcE n=1 Tax=Stieleria neptunia TaxID=2527979 RepID=A0A518I3K2_9BACT|nr:MFS transporter [Stieleria neptunia]QDV47607.1 Inner membrane protein YqcE [Stieleria neptunia]